MLKTDYTLPIVVHCDGDGCGATLETKTKYRGQARDNAKRAGWTFVPDEVQPRDAIVLSGDDYCPSCPAGVPLRGETDF